MAGRTNVGQSSSAPVEASPVKPPLPKFMYGIVNPVMKAILRSPLHGLLSKSLMVLSFQGRKSGRRYSLPVGYLEQGNTLFVFSHGPWWKNFRGGAPVSVRLRGQERRGIATIMQDPAAIVTVVGALTTKHGEKMTRRMGLALEEDGAPPRSTIFIEITL